MLNGYPLPGWNRSNWKVLWRVWVFVGQCQYKMLWIFEYQYLFVAFLSFLISLESYDFSSGPSKPKMAKGHWHVGNWSAKTLLFWVKVHRESSSISYCSNSYQPTVLQRKRFFLKIYGSLFALSTAPLFIWCFFLVWHLSYPVITPWSGSCAKLRQALDSRRKSAFAPSNCPSCRARSWDWCTFK